MVTLWSQGSWLDTEVSRRGSGRDDSYTQAAPMGRHASTLLFELSFFCWLVKPFIYFQLYFIKYIFAYSSAEFGTTPTHAASTYGQPAGQEMKTHFCSHSESVQVNQLTQPVTKNDTGLPCGSGKLSLQRLVHCSHVGRHARNVNRLLFARSRSIQVNLNKLIHHNAIIARTNQYQRGSWEKGKKLRYNRSPESEETVPVNQLGQE